MSLACLAAVVAIAASPVLAAIDAPRSSSRVTTLDGLRGFLALSVVLHHGIVYRQFLQSGDWAGIPGFCNLLGGSGVAMFFMLTGYLFWGRLIARRGRIDWIALYVGRLFRIGPLFLIAALAALLTTFALAPDLVVRPSELAGQIAPYLLLGMASIDTVNGYPTPLLLVRVVWTLQYEWLFYLLLPLLGIATRRRTWHLPFALSVLAAAMASLSIMRGPLETKLLPIAAALFGIGMVTASLHARGFGRRGYGVAGSIAVLALAVFAVCSFSSAYARPAMLTLGAMFYLVASGCSVFGALTRRSALRLGEISYGIYLLQGLALAAVLRPEPLRALAASSPLWHAALVVAAIVLLVFVAAALHVFIERPGIRLGRRVCAAVAGLRPVIAISPEGLEPR